MQANYIIIHSLRKLDPDGKENITLNITITKRDMINKLNQANNLL